MTHARPDFLEHAGDVLAQLHAWLQDGRDTALAVITGTEGGAVRPPGALMAVRDDGRKAGYLSGGCIDADLALHGDEALRTGRVKHLRYGANSPFADIKLPCGGAIDVMVIPAPDRAVVASAAADLRARRAVQLSFHRSGALTLADDSIGPGWRNDAFAAHYVPNLRLRIAGRGADCFALAQLARASQVPVELQLSSDADSEAALALGFPQTRLTTPRDLPPLNDDAWTAVVLMLHDKEWERALISQALSGPAFFVGAVGSRRAHDDRCAELRRVGCLPHQIARVRGPIGLLPAMREASTLAVSALSEIVRDYNRVRDAPARNTALLLLAAGASSRFEHGDKLLAPLMGEPMLAHAARLLRDPNIGARVAIVGPNQEARRRLLERHGWTVVENHDAANGQATSITAGLKPIAADAQIERVLIVLGDMPFVTDAHLEAMLKCRGVDAILSQSGEIKMPPALFARSRFDALLALRGDQGARDVYESAANKGVAPLTPLSARDIDTVADLADARA